MYKTDKVEWLSEPFFSELARGTAPSFSLPFCTYYFTFSLGFLGLIGILSILTALLIIAATVTLMPAEQNLSTSTITSIMENQKKLLSLACINNGFDVGNGVTEIELFDSKNSPSIDVPPFAPQPKPSTSIASPTASRKPKKVKVSNFTFTFLINSTLLAESLLGFC